MGEIASLITSLTIVYSGTDQSKHQSSASLAFVWGIHWGPVNSPHKWPVTRKMFPFDDVIMSHDLFTRILQDCFTGTGSSEITLMDMGKNNQYRSTNYAHILGMHRGPFYKWFFHRNPDSIEILFCCHQSNKLIAMNFARDLTAALLWHVQNFVVIFNIQWSYTKTNFALKLNCGRKIMIQKWKYRIVFLFFHRLNRRLSKWHWTCSAASNENFV